MRHLNLPDDWDNNYEFCNDCGGRYHASLSEACRCVGLCYICGRGVAPEVSVTGLDVLICWDCEPEYRTKPVDVTAIPH